jgi:hypothetical protein
VDWNLAIDINRQALKRVLAALVAMAGFGGVSTSPSTGAGPAASGGSRPLDAFHHATGMMDFGHSPKPASLPRYLHRAVLRLLRPAEAAARRLIIVAAREIVVPPTRPRQRKPKPAPVFLRRGSGGTGVFLPPGFVTPPPTPLREGEANPAHGSFSSLLREGASGGGAKTPARRLGFPLLDPLPRYRRHRPAARGVPRISCPGYTRPFGLASRRPPAPDDPVDAVRLGLRLAALGRVLDDLPRAAMRFARWRVRAANAARAQDRKARRIWPLKPGLPPGARRPGSRREDHGIDEILSATHGLAFWTMTHAADTS